MKRQEEKKSELRARLRRGDPARDGHDSSVNQIAHMRREMLVAAEEAPFSRLSPVRFGLLATAAASLALIAGALWLAGNGAAVPPGTPIRVDEAQERTMPETNNEETRPARQIQFSTPGGTRVIWSLDPDFNV